MKALDFTNPDFAGTGLKWGRWAAIAVVGLIVISSCFTTVAAGNVGVPVTFGEVGNSVWNPGLHIKMPFITSVVYDPQLLLLTLVLLTTAGVLAVVGLARLRRVRGARSPLNNAAWRSAG